MKSEAETVAALKKYADTVRRICFLHLHNYSDVEDVFQDVFLKYLLHSGLFESESHEQSWLVRVAINACKDIQKSAYRRRVDFLEDADTECLAASDENYEVLDAVRRLPPKYRDVIYLHYYEGYTAGEIAAILRKRENTIYTWLSRARIQLKPMLEGGGER